MTLASMALLAALPLAASATPDAIVPALRWAKGEVLTFRLDETDRTLYVADAPQGARLPAERRLTTFTLEVKEARADGAEADLTVRSARVEEEGPAGAHAYDTGKGTALPPDPLHSFA